MATCRGKSAQLLEILQGRSMSLAKGCSSAGTSLRSAVYFTMTDHEVRPCWLTRCHPRVRSAEARMDPDGQTSTCVSVCHTWTSLAGTCPLAAHAALSCKCRMTTALTNRITSLRCLAEVAGHVRSRKTSTCSGTQESQALLLA